MQYGRLGSRRELRQWALVTGREEPPRHGSEAEQRRRKPEYQQPRAGFVANVARQEDAHDTCHGSGSVSDAEYDTSKLYTREREREGIRTQSSVMRVIRDVVLGLRSVPWVQSRVDRH